MIEGNLQLDTIVAVMLILQPEVSENRVGAVQQFNGCRFTGCIFPDKGRRVECIQLRSNLLKLILFILLDKDALIKKKISLQFSYCFWTATSV